MHPLLAGAMAIGVSLVTIGLGMALVSHSEMEGMIQSGATDLDEQLESLNDRSMAGVYLASIGAGVTVFALLIDENRRKKEREKKRGFLY